MIRSFIAGSFFILFLFNSLLFAGEPLNTVQTNVNKVLEILREKSLKTDAKKEKLRVIYGQMFDEVELSRRTLAQNWSKLNPDQQKEFVQLYQQVLEKAYADKILTYTNEKIAFTKESPLSKNQTEVQTKIITSSKEIPTSLAINW